MRVKLNTYSPAVPTFSQMKGILTSFYIFGILVTCDSAANHPTYISDEETCLQRS